MGDSGIGSTVARFTGSTFINDLFPGAHAPGRGPQPSISSPAEHLGWGGRLYAYARFAGWKSYLFLDLGSAASRAGDFPWP
jgi:hypothetical protein